MAKKNKVINEEMERRHISICFECGAVFEANYNSTCPDCESYLDTRHLTVARTWLGLVRLLKAGV